jgi:cytochrome c oxidase subunit 2
VIRAPHRAGRPLKVFATIAFAALLAAACQSDSAGIFPPSPVTQQGVLTQDLYRFVFAIATAIFLLVEGLIVWAVLRYRRRDDSLPAQTHGNLIAEATWTIVPAIIVVALFVLSMQAQGKIEAKSAEPDVVVDVLGFQWQWTIGYGCPDSYADAPAVQPAKDCAFAITGAGKQGPDLHVPTGQTIRFRLHAADVIHAFYVPRFLYKKDVIPGRVNSFDVVVEQPGTYAGQCAELCGLGHAEMFLSLTAEDRGAYDAWYAAQVEGARQTPAPTQAGAFTINISATTAAAFDQTAVSAPADTPLAIVFENKDQTVQHNVTVLKAGPDGGDLIGQPFAQPGTTVTYQVPALKAGTYTYVCSIHPNMTGTLTVQ